MRDQILLFALPFLSIIAFAQYGTAPSNYYPNSYGGSVFKGVVTENIDNQIVLTFTKGDSIRPLQPRSRRAAPFPLLHRADRP